MSEDIYRKGLRLALQGHVELDVAEAKAAYYRVRGDTETHDVRLEASNAFSCTCMWGALHAAKDGALCSHVVAAVVFRGLQGEPLPSEERAVLKGAMTLAKEPAPPKPKARRRKAED
ncbi:MAG TPA: hypothetical protein VGR28_08000 [Candidatus Thermoplasmatota archaeon]|jgi:hypothetical protein|nr:hypothetical protein [Candidatus Thermoplasmatota archaeon]